MKFINEKALVEHAEVIDLKMFNNENASNRDQLWLKQEVDVRMAELAPDFLVFEEILAVPRLPRYHKPMALIKDKEIICLDIYNKEDVIRREEERLRKNREALQKDLER